MKWNDLLKLAVRAQYSEFPNFLDSFFFFLYGFTLYDAFKLFEFLQVKTSDTGWSEISD